LSTFDPAVALFSGVNITSKLSKWLKNEEGLVKKIVSLIGLCMLGVFATAQGEPEKTEETTKKETPAKKKKKGGCRCNR
jgi:hypothetical protein